MASKDSGSGFLNCKNSSATAPTERVRELKNIYIYQDLPLQPTQYVQQLNVGDRVFTFSAAKQWNALSLELGACHCLSVFTKKNLETFLFVRS